MEKDIDPAKADQLGLENDHENPGINRFRFYIPNHFIGKLKEGYGKKLVLKDLEAWWWVRYEFNRTFTETTK